MKISKTNLDFLVKLTNSIVQQYDDDGGKIQFWTWHNGTQVGTHKSNFASDLCEYLKLVDKNFNETDFLKRVKCKYYLYDSLYDVNHSKLKDL